MVSRYSDQELIELAARLLGTDPHRVGLARETIPDYAGGMSTYRLVVDVDVSNPSDIIRRSARYSFDPATERLTRIGDTPADRFKDW